MKRARSRCGAALFALGLACCARTAHAADDVPADVATQPMPRVELTIVGKSADFTALETHVLSWFRAQNTEASSQTRSRLDAATVFAKSERASMRIWLVLQAPQHVRVIFSVQDSPASAPRYLVHEVTLDRGLDELGLEQLGQVVYLSASALWTGNEQSSQQEVARSLPPAPTPTPVTKPPPRTPAASSRLVPRFGLEYRARFAGADGVDQGPGAAVALAWQSHAEQRSLLLHAGWLIPHRPTNDGVELDLRGASLALGAELARRVAEKTWLSAELGPGLDLLRYRTIALSEDSLRAHAGAWNYRPFAWLALGAQRDFGPFSAAVAGVLSATLVHTHYDVASSSGTTTLFQPWRVQPGFSVGIFW